MQFRVIMVTDLQTNKQTHTHRQDRLQYTAPLSLACSVKSAQRRRKHSQCTVFALPLSAFFIVIVIIIIIIIIIVLCNIIFSCFVSCSVYFCIDFQEMLISPALLDFLEQAIEPIPVVMSLSGTSAGKGSKNGK